MGLIMSKVLKDFTGVTPFFGEWEATYPPGPVTMTHVIEDAQGWRLLISDGEILDTPPLKINECSLVVRIDRDVKQFLKELIKFGFAHHAIIAPGKVADYLKVFAEQLDLEICRL